MIKYMMDLEKVTPLGRKQIEYLVQVAGRFESRILFIHQCRTINGKSMLGLLSLGATGDDPVQVVIEGEDEEEAGEEIHRILSEGVQSPKDAGDAENLLLRIKSSFQEILGEKLAGLYVHGSLACSCFNWEKSDIDLFLVVKSDPGIEKKVKLCRVLYDLRKEAPPHGFDMVVMLQEVCRDPGCPVPYLMRWTSRTEPLFEADPEGCVRRIKGEEAQMICRIADVRSNCITLLGPGENRMFGPVYREDVLDAVRSVMKNAQEGLHDHPVYYVLALCRSIAFLRANTLLSKKQAGQWALQNLDKSYQATIQAALNAYAGSQDMFYDKTAAEDLLDEYLPELGIEVTL